MLSKSDINNIVISSIKEVIEKESSINIKDDFIGINASIESIDIVQIISGIEDKLSLIHI